MVMAKLRGYLATLTLGYVATWLHQHLSHLATWLRGYINTWVRGYLATWLYINTWLALYVTYNISNTN